MSPAGYRILWTSWLIISDAITVVDGTDYKNLTWEKLTPFIYVLPIDIYTDGFVCDLIGNDLEVNFQWRIVYEFWYIGKGVLLAQFHKFKI